MSTKSGTIPSQRTAEPSSAPGRTPPLPGSFSPPTRRVYGEYPPLSSLNYISANRDRGRDYIPNPFTDKAMMIPVDTGAAHVGKWRTHTVDIREDYRNAFGKRSPKRPPSANSRFYEKYC